MSVNENILLMILGMSVVTYIPRALPVAILNRLNLSKQVEGVLKAIPYAALGALIFPGILSVNSQKLIVGVVGGTVAVILAYLKLNITFVICGAVAAVIMLQVYIL
ncbi:AzlD domain-containing protein [Cellulosilyticum ruminicola]|uniref:AzlD domain-containing protein n=1 Tax=Cellulosilyticum ruminicola TaxID=425254 RepID=UPI0006D19319|nr:AzlD domain-containing protein [Cellulosilyticum ruminicola]